MRLMLLATVVVVLAGTVTNAQEISTGRDFLTEFEADLIRKAQDPKDRVPQYLEFAKLRMALIDQLLATKEPGRGAKLHKNLDELGRIVESIDIVIDDALLKDADLEKVIPGLVAVEEDLLSRLEAIQDGDVDDLWRYEFVLEDAIDILTDSIEMSSDDQNSRKLTLIESENAEKAARQRTMTPQRREEMEKANEEQEEEVRKRPSLLKDGETLGNQGTGRIQ